eukprot:2649739-Rhodomonas_salina.6
MLLRIRVAVGGTGIGCAATRLSGTDTTMSGTGIADANTVCAVLRSGMLLPGWAESCAPLVPPYAHALRCPVLSYHILRPLAISVVQKRRSAASHHMFTSQ